MLCTVFTSTTLLNINKYQARGKYFPFIKKTVSLKSSHRTSELRN